MCFNHLLNPCPTPTPAVTKWLRQIPSAGAPLPKAALFMPSSEHGSSSYTLAICLDVDSEPSPLLFLPHLSLGLGKQHTLSLYLSPWLHPPRHTSTPFLLQVSYLPEVLTRHQVTIFPHVVYVRAETLFSTQHQNLCTEQKVNNSPWGFSRTLITGETGSFAKCKSHFFVLIFSTHC